MSDSDPPPARRADDSADESRPGYDTEDLDRAYAAGRSRGHEQGRQQGRRNTLAVMLPLLIVATVAALVPCALGAYLFLICTGGIK